MCERAPALQVDVLKRDLSDGLVLCALAERLTGIKLAPLPPKTPSLRRANLRKALGRAARLGRAPGLAPPGAGHGSGV